MQIHEIIRTRRTALGLTQEQLAGKLGVSAPAVNKWERGNSYPDITLLPVLARTLRVDLNTLLSFREDLTETEIAEFLNRLYEVSRTEGCGAAFSLAEEKLRQFPNSDALAYSAAGLLEGLLTLFPGTDETARPGREDFVAGLYEQAAQSADPKIREWATYTVASRCIARGDLDRAEALYESMELRGFCGDFSYAVRRRGSAASWPYAILCPALMLLPRPVLLQFPRAYRIMLEAGRKKTENVEMTERIVFLWIVQN